MHGSVNDSDGMSFRIKVIKFNSWNEGDFSGASQN